MKIVRSLVTLVLVVAALGMVGWKVVSCSSATHKQVFVREATPSPEATPGVVSDGYVPPVPPKPVVYGLNPYGPNYNPHRMFNENMARVEKFANEHEYDGDVAIDEEPVRSAVRGLDEMYRNRKQLGISDATLRSAYVRLFNYYDWSHLSYDPKTDARLKKYAAMMGVKYRLPRYWQWGKDHGWWLAN